MSFGRNILMGMMGAYLKEGLDIDKLDLDNHVLYITVPKSSDTYDGPGAITSPETFAKRIKETWIEMGIFPKDKGKVFYKIKDVHWTVEMGEENYKKNKDKVLNLSVWG